MARIDCMKLEDMPIRGHVKGMDRVFVYGNEQDDKDLRKILADSPPAILWVDEDEYLARNKSAEQPHKDLVKLRIPDGVA